MNLITNAAHQRAVLYLRVSTTRQADQDVSIPDQRKQCEGYCRARGYEVVEAFIEPGASATSDRRPEFQKMIEAGAQKPPRFDMVVVHSFSRFFRDHFEFEYYVRKLAKNGVKLISITQEIGDDPMHLMMRQIMSLFDEYQSRENGKHVMRAMKENAIQGFWNGSPPPLGYRLVTAEVRGGRPKKKLEVDPVEAETIRFIYRLFLKGDGKCGPLGIKKIVSYLNERGIWTRNGGRWGVGVIHKILTRPTYIGLYEFNRHGKDGKPKPGPEIIAVAVPPIIDRAVFDTVAARLKSRNSKAMPARLVGSPIALTGICFCAKCGGAMTLRTGKGGRYRYYTCSTRARQGAGACEGQSVQMGHLDEVVVRYLDRRLFYPDRFRQILATVLGRRQEQAQRRRTDIAALNRQAGEAEARLARIYDAIERGIVDLSAPDLQDRVINLQAARDEALAHARRAATSVEGGERAITPAMVGRFLQAVQERIWLEGGTYRREHLRALIRRVEVADGRICIASA